MKVSKVLNKKEKIIIIKLLKYRNKLARTIVSTVKAVLWYRWGIRPVGQINLIRITRLIFRLASLFCLRICYRVRIIYPSSSKMKRHN